MPECLDHKKTSEFLDGLLDASFIVGSDCKSPRWDVKCVRESGAEEESDEVVELGLVDDQCLVNPRDRRCGFCF